MWQAFVILKKEVFNNHLSYLKASDKNSLYLYSFTCCIYWTISIEPYHSIFFFKHEVTFVIKKHSPIYDKIFVNDTHR